MKLGNRNLWGTIPQPLSCAYTFWGKFGTIFNDLTNKKSDFFSSIEFVMDCINYFKVYILEFDFYLNGIRFIRLHNKFHRWLIIILSNGTDFT